MMWMRTTNLISAPPNGAEVKVDVCGYKHLALRGEADGTLRVQLRPPSQDKRDFQMSFNQPQR